MEATHTPMQEAMSFFTGGAYIPSGYSEALIRLEKCLQRIPATSYEYLYYILHYGGAHIGPAALQRHNWLAHDSTLQDFEVWYRKRNAALQMLVTTQLEHLQCYAKLGLDMLEALRNPDESLAAPVRLEAAFVYGYPPETLAMYKDEAVYMCVGNPAYAGLCPRAYGWLGIER